MALSRHDVWGHFAPMFHLVDVFAVYAVTLVGGRHVTLPTFTAPEALLAIGVRRVGHQPGGRPAAGETADVRRRPSPPLAARGTPPCSRPAA